MGIDSTSPNGKSTLHVFAISGLHIAMIAVMLAKFLQWCGVNRSLAASLVLPLIWFYTAATGFQASAIRSTIMCSVVMVGWILKRPSNLLNSLAVSAILIFLWQAEQLFQAGFQLSFVLLLVIALWPPDPFPNPGAHLRAEEKKDFERPIRSSKWSRLIAWFFERWTGRDPLLPSDLRPFTRRMMDPFATWTLNGLHISIASALGSLPIIASYFNLISFSSVVANLVIVPLSGVALGASLASLGGAFIPFLSIAANGISWMTMDLMVRLCQWLEGFRSTYTYVESPGWLFIAGYYVCFLAITQGWLRERIAKVAVAAVIVIVCANSYWNETRRARVTMLPGSGVIFVDAPWNKNDFLIDCGRDREAGAIVQPFLRAQGVDQLEAIVLTHGDVAHVEGYERLAREFRVKKTFTSAARSRSPKYREILRWLEGSPGWKKVSAGDEIAGWKALHPPIGQDYSRADDEAIVLQKDGLLLISELGREGQRTLAALGTALKSEVVFCGVASDGTSLREELLELIKPAVIALGGNEPKVARAAEALRRRGATVRTTMEERAIVFEQGRIKGMVAD